MSSVREHNQLAILETIFTKGETSRALLAKELRVSKPAISDNLEPLLNLGIVEEAGEGESAALGGRKPIMLRFNGGHKYIIAIDLNYSRPFFVLGSLDNQILTEFEVPVDDSADSNAYLRIIKNGINILMASHNVSEEDLACIAIASPGMFDDNGNLCSINPLYKGFPWATINIRPYLNSNFNIPVIIKNDILAATVGEWEKEESRPDDMLFLGCGLGLGSGIIIDSELYEGRNFSAGQLFDYIDSETIKTGKTLEDRVCINGLLQKIKLAVEEGKTRVAACSGDGDIVFQDVVDAYSKGDPFVMSCIRSIGEELGVVALNMMSFLSIKNLILGGEYAVFGETLLESMGKVFSSYGNFTPNLKISKQGRYSGIFGLFSLSRSYYFHEVCKCTRKAD